MTTTEERTIVLRVLLSDAQRILNALSGMPHREVSVLIPALMGQIQEQLKAPVVQEKGAIDDLGSGNSEKLS